MIINLWESIELYCARHNDELQRMTLMQIGTRLYYVCPKTQSKNLAPDECLCNNKVSVDDYEKMVDHIDQIITEATLNGEEVNLTNYQFRKRLLQYKVLSHDKVIKVVVSNKEHKR